MSSKMQYKKYNQRGSVVLFSILVLTVIITATLSIAAIFLPKIRSISEASNSVGSIFAADSAIEWCLYGTRKGPVNQPVMSQLFPGQTPSYIITPSSCNLGDVINHRAVGTFGGVSRSFEVQESN